MGSHPGALSSCCVCASFFCAPHRCYENLRSPAGKVTSLGWCCLSPGPCLGPCSGWGGLPSTHPAAHTSCLPFSPHPSFPTSLPVCAGSLVLSFFPSLFCQRDIWGNLLTQERTWASHSTFDEFIPCEPWVPEFASQGLKSGVANSHPTFPASRKRLCPSSPTSRGHDDA